MSDTLLENINDGLKPNKKKSIWIRDDILSVWCYSNLIKNKPS